MSPSFIMVGRPVRTVWLGRTIVQASLLWSCSSFSQAILRWLYSQYGFTAGVFSVIT